METEKDFMKKLLFSVFLMLYQMQHCAETRITLRNGQTCPSYWTKNLHFREVDWDILTACSNQEKYLEWFIKNKWIIPNEFASRPLIQETKINMQRKLYFLDYAKRKKIPNLAIQIIYEHLSADPNQVSKNVLYSMDHFIDNYCQVKEPQTKEKTGCCTIC